MLYEKHAPLNNDRFCHNNVSCIKYGVGYAVSVHSWSAVDFEYNTDYIRLNLETTILRIKTMVFVIHIQS